MAHCHVRFIAVEAAIPENVALPEIMAIIESNQLERLNVLLSSEGFNVNEKLPNGHTALLYAVYYERWDMAKILLEHGADVNAAYNHFTCLFWAIKYSNDDFISLLFTFKFDLKKVESSGSPWLPLHRATRANKLPIMELLLENGANVNLPDDIGRYPLFYAIANEKASSVELLLKYGASTNVDRDGTHGFLSPFVLKTPKMRDLFVRHGAADAETFVDARGASYLFHAVAHSEYEYIEHLLLRGLNANKKNNVGKTPLAMLLLNCCDPDRVVSVIRLLVSYGAAVNDKLATPTRRYSPLCYAAETGSLKVVDCLLDLGATINDPRTESPLFAALRKSKIAVFEHLIRRGALLNVRSWPDRRTLVNFAMTNNSSSAATGWDTMTLEAVQMVIECKGVVCAADYQDFANAKRQKLDALRSELEAMRVSKVCDSSAVTYLNILLGRGYQLAKYLRNKQLVGTLLVSNRVKELFPLFSNRLLINARRGLGRVMLFDRVYHFASEIFSEIFPGEIIEMIVMYFDDAQLLAMCA